MESMAAVEGGSVGARERPEQAVRERLARLGPGALTDPELLMLVVGNPRLELGVADGALKRAGGLRALALLPWDALQSLPGMGCARSAQVLAAIELGRRALRAPEKRPKLCTSDQVYRYLLPLLAARRKEAFHVLCLNVRLVLLSDTRISEGSVEACPVDPREAYAAALAVRANAVILAHNHPSGDSEPSSVDWALNDQLMRGFRLLGIRLIDHLVIGDSGYTSLQRTTRPPGGGHLPGGGMGADALGGG